MSKHKKSKDKLKVSLLSLIEQKIDIEKLLDSIYLNEDNVIESTYSQPKLSQKAGQFRVQRLYKRVKLETELNTVRAKVGSHFRSIRDNGGRRELTEGAVKERIELDPAVRRLRKQLDRAIVIEEFAKILQDVFRTRSDSIRTIVAAGKISLHLQELELFKSNKKLGRMALQIREAWRNNVSPHDVKGD